MAAERKYNSSDIPRFDVYPAPSPSGPADPAQIAGSRYQREGFDEAEGADVHMGGSSRLVRTAETIGSTLGHARARLEIVKGGASQRASSAQSSLAEATEGLRSRADELGQRAQQLADDTRLRAQHLAGDLRERAEEIAEDARVRAHLLGMDIRDKADELRHNAQRQWEGVRARGIGFWSEKPLYVLAGIAAAAFIAGVAVRIVRARNV